MGGFCILRRLIASYVAVCWLATAACADEAGVGFRRLSLIDPVGGGKMYAVLFYPAAHPTAETVIGPYRVDAAGDAGIAPARYPLIAFSHGTAGSSLGHHDLASFLARHGYVVVAPTHPHDNFQDQSGIGSDAILLGRPQQLSAAIDAALQDPVAGPHIDPQRIGAAGYSAGGLTVLILAGGQPDLKRLQDYCRTKTGDELLCISQGAIRQLRPDLRASPDSRIRAVFAMAPVGAFFSKEDLARITIPVAIMTGSQDEILPVARNAEMIRDNLPVRPAYETIAGAGHFVFLAPCSEALRQLAPAICTDPAGVDRKAAHVQIAMTALRFFDGSLKGD